jgi:hypothetical protein
MTAKLATLNRIRGRIFTIRNAFYSGFAVATTISGRMNRWISSIQGILNSPGVLALLTKGMVSQLAGRITSLQSDTRSAIAFSTNAIFPESQVDASANLLEAVYTLPEAQMKDADEIAATEEQKRSVIFSQKQLLMHDLLETFTESVAQGLVEFSEAKRLFGKAPSPQNIYHPSTDDTSRMLESAQLGVEYLFVYHVLSVLQLYEDYEFSNTKEAIEFLSLLNTIVKTLLELRLIDAGFNAQILQGIVGIRNEVLSQISELAQLYTIQGGGLSIRNIVYRVSGSLDNLEEAYQNNPVFDVADVQQTVEVEG